MLNCFLEVKQVPPGESFTPNQTDSAPRFYTRAFVWLAAAAIAFAMGLHIYRMSGLAFTDYDDMLMGLTADRMRTEGWWKSYFALANIYALWQGRIYFYFSMFFFVLPFLIRSLLLRAILSAALQLAATSSIAAVVGMYAGWTNALLAVALACAWMPYWPSVSPIIGFPFVYHLPVILFFAAMTIAIAQARGSIAPRWTRTAAAVSWAAFFVSLFFYEALLPPFALLAAILPAVEVRRARGVWDRAAILRAWAPWVAGFLLWAAIYLGFRKLHPGTYGGSALAGLGGGELGRAATALFYFETYSLPGANWIGNLHYNADFLSGSPDKLGYAPYFLRNLNPAGIVLAILLIALVILRVLALPPRKDVRRERRAAALAVICAVISPLPLAFTSKYRSLQTVLEVAPYLPGYYSYLAWCASAALAFPLVWFTLRRVRILRWAAVLAMAAVCAVAGAANAISDDAIYRRFAEMSDKWKLVDLLARTSWFAALPANPVFLAPGLWGNFPHTTWYHGDPYWSAYFSSWAGRPVQVIRIPRQVPELLSRHAPVFYCEHQWMPGRQASVLAIEPIVAISPSGDALSDSVLLLSRTNPAGMALEYRSPASGASGSGPRRVPVPQWRLEHGAYIARLAVPELIAGTVQIADAADAPAPGPVLQFGPGISALERDGANLHYWRWSDSASGEGEIDVFNPLPKPVDVRFRVTLVFDPRQNRAVFDLRRPGESETLDVAQHQIIERTWRLAPGLNPVVLKCHAGRIPAPGDTRYIVFGIRDWSLVPAGQ